MKKSKILVPAVALLALGMAATTSATVAWYTANANLTASRGVLENLTVTAAVSTASDATVYVKLVLSSNESETVQMTSADGYCYAVDANGKLINASQPTFESGNQYGTATWTYTFWYDQACTSNQITGDALLNIDTVAQAGISVDVTGAARTRLSLNAPSAVGTASGQFGNVFGSSLANKVTATVSQIDDGVITWSSGANIYFAIYGGAASDSPLKDKTALDAAIGTAAQNDGDGSTKLSQLLTVSNHTA